MGVEPAVRVEGAAAASERDAAGQALTRAGLPPHIPNHTQNSIMNHPLRPFVLPALAGLVPFAAAQVPPFGDQIAIADMPWTGSFDFAAIDVDLDGDLELFATSGSRVIAFENLGFNGFAPALDLAINQATPLGIQAADLDGDGDQDLVYCSRYGNAVRWLEFLGNGQWAAAADIGPLVGAWGLSVANVGGDNKLDVVATSFDTDKVVWFQQLPGGTFAAPVNVGTGINQPTEVCTADLTGDGLLDVVTASLGSNQIVWYRNLGGGSFASRVVITTAVNRPWAIAVADLDGNGWVDVLSASESDNKVCWYRNLSAGVFSSQQLLDNAATGARDIEAVDVDLDGRKDVVVAAQGLGGIRWYQNLGGTFFGPPLGLPGTFHSPTVARALDLDGDFDLDLVHGDGYWHPNETDIGASVCAGVPNSTGLPGTLVVSGSAEIARDGVALTALGLPSFSSGYFLAARMPGNVPNAGGGEGTLCLGGGIGRYTGPGQVMNTGPLHSLRLRLDLTRMPTPQGLVTAVAGQRWYFQAWHRDTTMGGGSTSNFSEAASLLFR